MPKHLAPLVLTMLIAGTAAAGHTLPLVKLPPGATIAVAAVVGDNATAVRIGPAFTSVATADHAVDWQLDARLFAVARAELERAGRFSVVPLALDAAKLGTTVDIARRAPSNNKLRSEVRNQIEALGPATGAAAYLVIGRAELPNNLDEVNSDLPGYGLYQFRHLYKTHATNVYARLRLHLIDAKSMRTLANRTIYVTESAYWINYQTRWEALKLGDIERLGATLGSGLDKALVDELRELGIEAPAAP